MLFVVVSVSDYTDVIAWFPDEAGAAVFAKFVATEGIPCHITALWKATRFERHGVRVPRNRIDELRRNLRLKRVANGMTPAAARSAGRRLAREGIPCCVAGESGYPVVLVPEPFLRCALSLLKLSPPPDAELTASHAVPDSGI
jgi:hypothetical protein